jgi:hypothetical protein
MLTKEDDEFLAHAGPGTPGREPLRRNWHPAVIARELTDERPMKVVWVLGEDLVLFKEMQLSGTGQLERVT